MEEDIRWKQRFENYRKALKRLGDAVDLANERELSDLEKQGLIQAFEFTFELGWNVLKDYFLYQGNPNITGSRDAIRNAYKAQLLEDGETWMDMINSRNASSHAYNQEIAESIVKKIISQYADVFEDLKIKMNKLTHE